MVGKTTPVAFRIPNALVECVDAWAQRTGQTRYQVLTQAFTDWLCWLDNSREWSTRAEARDAARELRLLGQKVSITGGRGHWRIVERTEVQCENPIPEAVKFVG